MKVLEGRTQERDYRASADVCVVGSGAGGSMMARDLAAAGLDVVVLEMGQYSRTEDFNRVEDQMLERLFQERAARSTADMAIRILQGEGVGGSTIHNTCLCKRTPPEVLELWADAYGVSDALPADLEDAFARTEAELSVQELSSYELNTNNRLFKKGCEALGYRSAYLHHNRVGCLRSGYCELGCPHDGKQNALKVLLPRAVALGATLISDARAEKVLTSRGRVTGVRGALLDADRRPHARFQIDARVVCLAGSAVGSAALHLRSGLPNPSGQVGRNLRIHPAAVVAGLFEEEVRGWQGIPQVYECTEFLDFSPGSKRQVWLLPAFAHPIGTASIIPGFGQEHFELMRNYSRVAALTAVIHDESAGRVRVRRNGRILIDYSLVPHDREQLVLGMVEGARILLAAGARKVLVPYEGRRLWIEDEGDLTSIERRGIPAHQLPLMAVHPMGTLRMGDDRTEAVVDSRGEHHSVRGLFVCDGSLFPTSIGVPPQISIYGFARHIAPHVIEACGRG